MVVSIGGVPVGAEDGAPGPARPGQAGRARRDIARGLSACALAAALAPVVADFRPQHPGLGKAEGDTALDQAYRGRRIRGVWTPAFGAA